MGKKGSGSITLKGKLLAMVVIVAVIVVAIIYYINIPAISIYSVDTWIYVLVIIGVIAILCSRIEKDGYKLNLKVTVVSKVVGIVLGLGIIALIVGGLASSQIFSAHRYANIIDIKDAVFEEDIKEKTPIDDIALMDTESAKIVGNRTIGSLTEVVSQFEVSGSYSQIAVEDKPMKVATLKYADFFKYMNNAKEGIPGYVMVDPITNEAKYVELAQGMKYTTSAYFNKNLKRHLRFQYPTAIFEGYYFEIDDEGNPYYVCPVLKANVGLFGAMDVKGVVVCDPVTGDSTYYKKKDIPDWVDRAYNGALLQQKYDWYGLLSGGYINSIFGNKGCKETTDDYGYKVMDGDMWIYTGITSVNGDQSNIGFVMMNTRTSDYRYYKLSGAEEHSAMASAEGEVQHLGYQASFPSLVNIGGEPTYVMVLKDNGGLVKLYAFVNIKKYSVVAIGSTQSEAIALYKKLLVENDIVNTDDMSDTDYPNKTITIEEIRYIVQDNETYVYISGNDGEVYKQDFADNESLILLNQGDKIKVYYQEAEDNINPLIKYER